MVGVKGVGGMRKQTKLFAFITLIRKPSASRNSHLACSARSVIRALALTRFMPTSHLPSEKLRFSLVFIIGGPQTKLFAFITLIRKPSASRLSLLRSLCLLHVRNAQLPRLIKKTEHHTNKFAGAHFLISRE